jgi:hypothetical protein
MFKNKTKKIIIIVLFLGLLLPRFTYAEAWPDIVGNLFGATYAEMLREMQNTIVDVLKQAAIQTINSTVNNAIGNGAGGPMFITDWNDYLIANPQRQTNVYINDLLTQAYSGRNSNLYSYGGQTMSVAPSGSYNLQTGAKTSQSPTLLTEGVGGNYLNTISQTAKSNDLLSSGLAKPDIQNYTNNPSQLFANGWTAPIKFFGNPANTEMGLETNLNLIEANTLQQQQMAAQIQAISNQGYLSVMKNGKVVTPGSALSYIQANTANLPNIALANADSIQGVAAALVTRLITKTITQGIWMAQGVAQSNINSAISSAKQQASGVPQSIFQPKY